MRSHEVSQAAAPNRAQNAEPSHTRRTMLCLIALAACYVVLFLPANFTGAKNVNMLAAFGSDEYFLFPRVTRIFSAGPTLVESLKHTFATGGYQYGYPYYLTSALVLLPVRMAFALSGSDADRTAVFMLVLRELSPLWMAVAILLLVYLWTEFESLPRAVLLFLFLGFVPGIFRNNLWWHPDSLAALLVVGTLFCLVKDDLHFGKWFYVAALGCGLATGTKLLGLYFLPVLVVYGVFGRRNRGLELKSLLKAAGLFLLIWASVYVVTNPQLLVPRMAKYILGSYVSEARYGSFGSSAPEAKGPLAWYHETLRASFGFWWFYILLVGAFVAGFVLDQKNRLLYTLTLSWTCCYSGVLLFCVARKFPHYAIPAFLPMFSCVGNPTLWNVRNFQGAKRTRVLLVLALAIVLGGYQFARYLQADLGRYTYTLTREQTSPSLAFYRKLDETLFGKLPGDKRLVVFRDPYVYLAPRDHLDITMKYGSASYADVESIHADLVLLQKDYIEDYSNEAAVEHRWNRDQARASCLFYRDAKNNSLKGFHKLLETEYAIAFARDQ